MIGHKFWSFFCNFWDLATINLQNVSEIVALTLSLFSKYMSLGLYKPLSNWFICKLLSILKWFLVRDSFLFLWSLPTSKDYTALQSSFLGNVHLWAVNFKNVGRIRIEKVHTNSVYIELKIKLMPRKIDWKFTICVQGTCKF